MSISALLTTAEEPAPSPAPLLPGNPSLLRLSPTAHRHIVDKPPPSIAQRSPDLIRPAVKLPQQFQQQQHHLQQQHLQLQQQQQLQLQQQQLQQHQQQHPHQHYSSNRTAQTAQPANSHAYDADATDSDHEPVYQQPIKNPGFRDFKYHDLMNLNQTMDETDTDEDSDEFIAERKQYMENSRKRQIVLEEIETQKRKVGAAPWRFGKLKLTVFSVVAKT